MPWAQQRPAPCLSCVVQHTTSNNRSSFTSLWISIHLQATLFLHCAVDLLQYVKQLFVTFCLFCLQPEEMDARLLSALITGIRRAFPYVPSEDVEPLVESNSMRLFRLVHTAPFSVGVQALMLVWQLLSGRGASSDRFYRALYAVLGTSGPPTSSKAPMFLALLFKAMRADPSAKRAAAFAKRLLQSALYGPSAYACGCLLLLSEVMKAQPSLWAGVQQPEDHAAAVAGGGVAGKGKTGPGSTAFGGLEEDDGLETFKDVADSDEEEGDGGVRSSSSDDEMAPASKPDKGKQQGQNGAAGKQGGKANGSVAGGRPGAGGRQGEEEDGAAARVASGQHASTSGAAWPRPGYYDMHKRCVSVWLLLLRILCCCLRQGCSCVLPAMAGVLCGLPVLTAGCRCHCARCMSCRWGGLAPCWHAPLPLSICSRVAFHLSHPPFPA